MNTYSRLTDALTAAKNNYGGTAPPESLVVLKTNDSYLAQYAERVNDATSINYQRGLIGIWGESARRAYRNHDFAEAVTTEALSHFTHQPQTP